MSYISGFVVAVPAANKDAYRKHAAQAALLIKEFGAIRIVDAWGDDVPSGEITDFNRAVKATPGEVIVFSWQEYPNKAASDAAYGKMISDPRMADLGATMPFEGQRMIIGGFSPLNDETATGKMGYVDGSLLPVPVSNKEAYRAFAAKHAAIIKEHGAVRVVDAWGDERGNDRLFLDRMAVKGCPRRGLAKGVRRSAHGCRAYALRSKAPGPWRLRPDPRRLVVRL